jgi:predicted Zn-dependent protease
VSPCPRERSDEYLARLEEAELIFEDEAFRAYVQGVTDTLLETRGLEAGEVRVVLLDLSSMNAAILANGTLLLHVGIASQIENEAQLATLLGHEIAHHTGRHALAGDVYEEQAEDHAKQSRIAAAVLLFPTGLWPLAFAGLSSNGGIDGVIAPQVSGYSQQQESEADRIGFETMLAAGYASSEAPRFFERLIEDAELRAEEQNDPGDRLRGDPFYYASHPDLVLRHRHIEALEAGQRAACSPASGNAGGSCRSGQGAEVGVARYMDRAAVVQLRAARIDHGQGRRLRAATTLERRVAHDASNAEAWALMGRIRSSRGSRPEELPLAIEALEHAVALDPERSEAHRELGFLYGRAGREDDSSAAFRRFLALEPDAPDRRLIEERLGGQP